MIDALLRRLGSWKNKFLSLGGRIVLLNSVLNSIPTYFLSFMRIPVSVKKSVISIRRKLLWGGVMEGKKIPWVKWLDVCKPKDLGSWGLKNIEFFNFSLLGKWGWRLLVEREAIWVSVLRVKYGEGCVHLLV